MDERLKTVMVRSARSVMETAARLKYNLRLASYAAAIEHINHVHAMRGVFP